MDWSILQRPEDLLWFLLKWAAVWVVVSVFVYFVIKRPLTRFAARAWRWLRRTLAAFALIKAALDTMFRRVSTAFEEAGDRRSVRLALNGAHKRLRDAMKRTVDQVRVATQGIRGLGGSKGDGLVDQIRTLREATEEAAKLGGDIDYDLHEQYGERLRAIVAFGFILLLAIAFAVANGLLMMTFMREVISVRIFGIPLAQIVAIVVVLLEIGIGYGLGTAGRMRNPAVKLLIILGLLAAAGISAWFEYHVFGLITGDEGGAAGGVADILGAGVGEDWLAPFGVGFVLVSCIMGFFLHLTWDELTPHVGKFSLGRELRAVKTYLARLPGRWEGIDAKAAKAEAQIESLVDSLGTRGGAISDVVKQIGAERSAMEKAIEEARAPDWDKLADGHAGDRRWAAAQNLGSLALMALALPACAYVYGRILAPAMMGVLPGGVGEGLGWVIALAFGAVGFLSFGRLHFVIGEGGKPERVYPLPASLSATIAAALVGVGAFAGLAWGCVRLFGPWGVLPAVLIVLVSAPLLTFCGYLAEHAVRGAALVLTVLAAIGIGLTLATIRVGAWAILALLATLFVIVSVLIAVLAQPTEAIFKAVSPLLARQQTRKVAPV